MNPHKQIIAIAELCGKECYFCKNTGKYLSFGNHEWTRVCYENKEVKEQPLVDCHHDQAFSSIPDYLNSLDACAEFERTLGGQLGLEYVARIEESQAERGIPKRLALLWADPQMRCNAFLKLHGKWENDT